ncbi:iron complex transport system substrate-binding protein [Saccharopolyspora antimicrobica]|uniref:Iron complex transport system substrate-binding protein n=1 Tax=Saccharopolyspora antimicrobica TaxID=455193 RepID=A0A1I4VA08_9PSEU|nr:ABC transporter substrate-binding protein [Saccharopolyspora antimicrobica]RKT86189.1 iron complex transport system substrate-binding protein [Saccharopolyspora antimicrobica]SFM98004.1 iron complex transport system substrate-binding protein [Saccharopolyspora antimicrobica]
MTRLRRLATLLLAALALLVGVTACATRPHSQTTAPADDPASAFPVKVQLPGQEPVTLPQQPKRIISLSPTATETLYAIGAGDQVIAVDQFSNFPAQAPRSDLSAFNADAAAVGGHNPDLVIAPDSSSQLAQGLKTANVPTLLTPAAANLDEAYRQIEVLGQATGHTQQAAELVARMRAEIDEIVRDTPKPPEPLTYYHEVSPDYYTATSTSFVGNVYSLFGLHNIADPAGGDFPQLSEEHILQANPKLIFLSDVKCCQVTAAAVAQRPGWNTLDAVRTQHVFELDDDIASRWGPRVVDMVRSIADGVSKAQQG